MKRFQHLPRSFLGAARARARAVKSRSRARTLFGRRRCVDITRNVAAVAPERSSLAYGPVVPEEHNSSRSITPRAIISSFQRGSPEVSLLPSSTFFFFFFFSLLFVPPTHAHAAGPRRYAYVRIYAYLSRCSSYGVYKFRAIPNANNIPVIFVVLFYFIFFSLPKALRRQNLDDIAESFERRVRS